MIGRVIEQQEALVAIFHARRELHYLEPSRTEWHILEDLYHFLEPFKDSTEILSGQQYPTLSCVGPILADLKEKAEQKDGDSRTIKSVKAAVDEDLNQRNLEPSLVLLMNTASFLDPRFKSLAHLSRATMDGVIKHVENEVCELMKINVTQTAANVDSADDCEVVEISDVEDSSLAVEAPPKKKKKVHPLKKVLGRKFGSNGSDRSTTMSINEQACAEVAKYRIEPQIDLDGKPLHWWRDHKSIYPTLCKLARKTLCIVATSVPSESLFSISGNVISQKKILLNTTVCRTVNFSS